jgi:peptidoglycan-associated lipoprotein
MYMVKKSIALTGIIGLVLCFSIMIMAGCAKKSVVREQPVTGEQKAAAAETTKEVAKKEQPVREEPITREVAKVEEETIKEKAAPGEIFKDINFDYDKYSLSPEAREILKKHADYLAKNRDVNVTIEGHCDERGTSEYNLALGERRAKEAMKYLKELGVSAKRMKTVSYGKEKPLEPGHNEEAWAKNRRDHFAITP